MREEGGLSLIDEAVSKLKETHKEHNPKEPAARLHNRGSHRWLRRYSIQKEPRHTVHSAEPRNSKGHI